MVDRLYEVSQQLDDAISKGENPVCLLSILKFTPIYSNLIRTKNCILKSSMQPTRKSHQVRTNLLVS